MGTVESLRDLDARCLLTEGDVVVLSVEAWNTIVCSIAKVHVVPATADRPAFFWYNDKKIVTPAAVGKVSGLPRIVVIDADAGVTRTQMTDMAHAGYIPLMIKPGSRVQILGDKGWIEEPVDAGQERVG